PGRTARKRGIRSRKNSSATTWPIACAREPCGRPGVSDGVNSQLPTSNSQRRSLRRDSRWELGVGSWELTENIMSQAPRTPAPAPLPTLEQSFELLKEFKVGTDSTVL